MPQRFLRPGITNSERWNAVAFDAQSLYIRLLTLVDDFGRYDGRASVIWAHCFAVWNEQNPQRVVSLQRVDEMLQELAASRLVDIYDAEGKRVLQILQWQERVREGCKEKWPGKPANAVFPATPARVAADSCKNLPPSPSPSPSPSSSPSGEAPADSPKLGKVEQIGYERELVRIGKELEKAGSVNDYPASHPIRKRIAELTTRQAELRQLLGVKA
jgi:hypothetical protein